MRIDDGGFFLAISLFNIQNMRCSTPTQPVPPFIFASSMAPILLKVLGYQYRLEKKLAPTQHAGTYYREYQKLYEILWDKCFLPQTFTHVPIYDICFNMSLTFIIFFSSNRYSLSSLIEILALVSRIPSYMKLGKIYIRCDWKTCSAL